MPSFTSNSNSRAPSAPYKKILILAFLGALIILTGIESLWRWKGQFPSVSDDMFLWAYLRSQVYAEENEARIVILGSSRSQVGIVPEVLQRSFPDSRVIHLAVDGHNPYASFRDLASDTKFDGVLLVDLTEKAFFPDNQEAQEPWVKNYQKEWSSWSRIEKLINLKIQVFLQSRLVLFNSSLSPRQLTLSSFRLPLPYAFMRPDRYRPAYYDRMTDVQLEEHRKRRIEIVTNSLTNSTVEREQEFLNILEEQVRPLVEQVHSRGGEVIFLRMPTCDEHWEIDEEKFPKSKYWDHIAPVTGAHAIHFLDYPELSSFTCPDTSHLDALDAPIFTEILAHEMMMELAVSDETGDIEFRR